jgi:hypothetical protein
VTRRLHAGTVLSELDLGPLRRALVSLRDGPPEQVPALAAEAGAALKRLSAPEARQ